MHALTIQEFCELTRSHVVGSVAPETVIRAATIDSREADVGTLFFAMPGSRTHGIRFARDAAARGAIIVTDRTAAADEDRPLLIAPSPRHALQRLAQFNREQSDALVIGITGSVGKTTTRRLLTTMLSATLDGIESRANYNNELGVPLSLLRIEPETEFAAIEMAASAPGQIASLCRIARPELAVITRIAPTHLSGFSSLDVIRATKQELVNCLPSDGIAFLNADDRLIRKIAASAKCRVVLFGQSSDADIRYQIVHSTNHQLELQIGSDRLLVPVCGRHHASSIAAAFAVANELGLSAADIQPALKTFAAPPGRVIPEVIGDLDVIDDTYNASPASVQAAAELLAGWQTAGRRIFVLGDMLDLGDQAEHLHFAVGVLLAQTAIDHTLAFGDCAEAVAAGFQSVGGPRSRISVFKDRATLEAMLDCLVHSGDAVLVKGSRGMAMERVVEGLRQTRTILQRRAAA